MCLKKFPTHSRKSLSICFGNFLSERFYPSELERVFYSNNGDNKLIEPISSDFIPAKSKHFLDKNFALATEKDLALIAQFEDWFDNKLVQIKKLEDKLINSVPNSLQINTIKAVLSQTKISIGISH